MILQKIKQYKVRIIIICLSMMFLCTFVVQKHGFHVDEVLSFQLGNSEFTPWIMPNQPEGRLVETYTADVYEAPVWMPGEHFEDYVECDGEDSFNLLSVYYNSKDDIHPPLYYMIVHLVCSVFQGEISVWHGCIINLLCIAGSLWLLGCIGDLLFKRKSSTAVLMLLYVFSTGIIATALWIRMNAQFLGKFDSHGDAVYLVTP